MLETPRKKVPKGYENGKKGNGQAKPGTKQDKSTPRKNESHPGKKGDGKKPKKLKVRLKQEPEIIEEAEVVKPVLIFPGLINEATRLSLSSPLRDTLEIFYLDVGHVPEQTILNIKQEFEDIFPQIQKKLTKVKSFLKFVNPVVPDFSGNDVITDGELEIFLPFKPPTYKEAHLEPGYMTVVVGRRKRDIDEDDTGTTEMFRSRLTTDSIHVSPIIVCQILYEGLIPPPPKEKKGKKRKKGDAIELTGADDINDGRASIASFPRGRSSVEEDTPRGGDTSRASVGPPVTPRTDRSDSIAMVAGEIEIRGGEDELSHTREDVVESRKSNGRTASRISGKGTPSAMETVSGSRPPSINRSVGSGVAPSQTYLGEDEDRLMETGRESIDRKEEMAIKVEPFVIDKCGAKVVIAHKSLRIRLVPCLTVRPGDEVPEHDLLVSKPFEHDENPQSHMLWRQSCLTRERVITRSMTRADGGVRLKALRTMIALAKIDPGLDGLTPYIIKTALLHNFDNIIDVTPRWQRNSIENCFIPLLKDLSSAFRSRRLFHFFLKDFNVLDGIHPTVYARIRSRLALLASSDAALIRALKRR
ncbi:uncharacterized protein LOC135483817 [Lineus longissimus]|uniref:uncharacterized protein LOC135483817 n=1 Tax=Lineus longissimus TaxID=88925 RepID=UPI002B4CEB12